MKPKKPKRSAVSKLKGEALAAYEQLRARLPNPPAGQVKLLEAGIGEYATRLPDVVLQLLDEAAPVSVADATDRAGAAGKTWQDVKATLELQLRLIRARAMWERGDTKGATAELVQVSASPSSRRGELILAAAVRGAPGWSPTFSLALLRSASKALANSLPAALALVDAMAGSGEHAAAAMVLGQVIAAWPMWPELQRSTLVELIGRLEAGQRAALEARLPAEAKRA